MQPLSLQIVAGTVLQGQSYLWCACIVKEVCYHVSADLSSGSWALLPLMGQG